jgi:hypothetical protein
MPHGRSYGGRRWTTAHDKQISASGRSRIQQAVDDVTGLHHDAGVRGNQPREDGARVVQPPSMYIRLHTRR